MPNLIDELKKILNLTYSAETAKTKEEATNSHNKIREIIGDLIEEFGRKVSGRIRSDDDIQDIMNTCQVMNQRGDLLNPFDLKNEDFDAYVIIDSLSKTYRFWNQTNLTVAEHCFTLAKVCKDLNPDPIAAVVDAKWALIHELYEAYTTDMATPVKAMLPEYKKAEDIALERFAKLAGICPAMPESVHLLDKRIMVDEALAYMPNKEYWLQKNEPIGISMRKEPLTPQEAKFEMAKVWVELGLPDINGSLAYYLSEEGQREEHKKEELFAKLSALPKEISFVDQYGKIYKKDGSFWLLDSDVLDFESDAGLISQLEKLSKNYIPILNHIIFTQDGHIFSENDINSLELENEAVSHEAIYVVKANDSLVYLVRNKMGADYYEWNNLAALLDSLGTTLTFDSRCTLEEIEDSLENDAVTSISQFNEAHKISTHLKN